MANKRASELRDKSNAELRDLLTTAQKDTVDLRFGIAARQTNNYARLRQLRRDIARLKYLLHERALNGEV